MICVLDLTSKVMRDRMPDCDETRKINIFMHCAKRTTLIIPSPCDPDRLVFVPFFHGSMGVKEITINMAKNLWYCIS